MAHQEPRPVILNDDVEPGDLSTPSVEKTPLTLSFINNVQSAVAQIEDRLANSPSAHPPPPSRQELPQTPPGPNDSVIERVQFLESSLSISPPADSKPTSFADSAFIGAINRPGSVLSSGVIISTTPPKIVSTNVTNHVNNPHMYQSEEHVPSTPLLETTDGEELGSTPSIAPIVEQFETPVTSVFTKAKEQDSAIVTVPIAPIVEQFEVTSTSTDHSNEDVVVDVTSGSIAPSVEHCETETSTKPINTIYSTNNMHTAATTDVSLNTPVTDKSEASTFDAPVLSCTKASSDPNLEPMANIFEKYDKSRDTPSQSVREHGVPTGNEVSAGAPSLTRPDHSKVTDEAALQGVPSKHEGAQTTSIAADEFTPVPVVDGVGSISDDLGKATGSGGAAAQTDMVNPEKALLIAPTIDKYIGGPEGTFSLDRDQHSPSIPTVLDEEANPSHGGAETTWKGNEPVAADVGHTISDAVDAVEPSLRPIEESEPHPSLSGGNNLLSELNNSAVRKSTTTNVAATVSSQQNGEGDINSVPTSQSNVGSDGIGAPLISSTPPNVDSENLEATELSSESEHNANDKSATVVAGDTSAMVNSGQPDNPLGTLTSVTITSDLESDAVPADGTVRKDNSTVAETDDASSKPPTTEIQRDPIAPITQGIERLRFVGTSSSVEDVAHDAMRQPAGAVTTVSASHAEGGLPDAGQSSGSACFTGRAIRSGVDAHRHGQASSDPSHEMQSQPAIEEGNSCALEETRGGVETEATKFEEVQHEEIAIPAESSQLLSREDDATSNTEAEIDVSGAQNTKSLTYKEPWIQASQKEHQETSEQEAREIMAAKAMFARDKLAKFALGSPVKRPHRAPFIRKTSDTRVSSMKTAGSVPVSPTIRRSPTGSISRKSLNSRTKLVAESTSPPISAMLDSTVDSPKQRKVRSPSISSRGTDVVSKDLPPRQSPTRAGKTPPLRRRSTAGYPGRENRDGRKATQSEQQSPPRVSQRSADNVSRLARAASLTSTGMGSSTTPEFPPTLPTRTKIPRAATFSSDVPRSKSTVSSPVLSRKVGVSSSPVTPSNVQKPSSISRPPLRRALSFTHAKLSDTSFSSASRSASPRSGGGDVMSGMSRYRGSDIGSTLSLTGSGTKPPRGGRPRFTVPEPFALTGPELQEMTEKQMEENRRKEAEAAARPRVFKPKPMPDFSRPYPKPHNK